MISWRLKRWVCIHMTWLHRLLSRMTCEKCGRSVWSEEIIVNFGWCNACFDESWDIYMGEA